MNLCFLSISLHIFCVDFLFFFPLKKVASKLRFPHAFQFVCFGFWKTTPQKKHKKKKCSKKTFSPNPRKREGLTHPKSFSAPSTNFRSGQLSRKNFLASFSPHQCRPCSRPVERQRRGRERARRKSMNKLFPHHEAWRIAPKRMRGGGEGRF